VIFVVAVNPNQIQVTFGENPLNVHQKISRRHIVAPEPEIAEMDNDVSAVRHQTKYGGAALTSVSVPVTGKTNEERVAALRIERMGHHYNSRTASIAPSLA
jgi:hypothetical protein